MRFSPLAAALAAAVVLAAGCGGTTTYTADATRACLEGDGVKVAPVPASDLIATTAEGGSVAARFPDNEVTVSFGVDRDGAEQIVRRYQRFRGKNIGLEDVLHAKGNAVMLWALHPLDSYVATIEGCLK